MNGLSTPVSALSEPPEERTTVVVDCVVVGIDFICAACRLLWSREEGAKERAVPTKKARRRASRGGDVIMVLIFGICWLD